ncbi:C-type lectin domain family 12 member B-like [Protopterus annectens]|uniref:C-type lectin domain family 12 member B-like n=1 Tax=Protopterus annectens TaxID=7888 RepID=UPI001CFB111A|nr:C-type lectin domain family 12 member B-like [Protopterus annectens]
MEEQRTYLELQNATEDVYSAVSPPSINKGVTQNSNVYTIGPITQSIRLKKRNHLRNIMIAGGVIALLLLTTILAVTIALFLQSKQASHTNVDFINFFCDLAELDQSNLEYTNPPGVKQKTDEDEDDDMDTHSIISFLSELLTKQHRVLEFLKAKYCNRCPSRWVQYKENCYFFSETRLDWYTSRHNCLKENADLVVIKRTEEQVRLCFFPL